MLLAVLSAYEFGFSNLYIPWSNASDDQPIK